MLISRYGLSLAVVTLTLGVPMAGARQQAQQPQSAPQTQQPQNPAAQPIPAYRSPLASAADNSSVQDNSTDADQLEPDTRPLAGAQDLSLGAPKTGHGFWQPFLYVTSSGYSNGATLNSAGSDTGWTTLSSVAGGVNLRQVSGNSDFTLSYLGGGAFSPDSVNDSVVQELGIAERFTLHRSVIALMDQLGYLPQAGFGYNGLGAGVSSTAGNIGLQTAFTPTQSILTAAGQRVSNTSVLELNRYLTRRSSFTFVGSYDVERFLYNNFSNSNETILQGGYNYQLNPKATFAVFYRFDAFRYTNDTQSINSHSVQISYARRLVGKLAFQIAGGPDYVISRIPISTSGSAATSGNTTQLSWVANSALTYQTRRNQFQAMYTHGVTAGSGVLAGSIADTVSGTATRTLTHTLIGALTSGYSRNTGEAIAGTTTATTILPNETYNYVFGGVNFSRTWGRSINLNFSYQAQYQTSSLPSCITTPCSTSFVTHQVSASVGWNPRLIVR